MEQRLQEIQESCSSCEKQIPVCKAGIRFSIKKSSWTFYVIGNSI